MEYKKISIIKIHNPHIMYIHINSHEHRVYDRMSHCHNRHADVAYWSRLEACRMRDTYIE